MLLSRRLSKFYRVVPTYTRSGLVHGIELDRAGRPNLSMAARHVVLAEQKLTSYVYAVDKQPIGHF
ncbi:hypothetical protein TIFTF001_040294 [Ficus carica]|uniref:Uncharacterized protein n=1 Tax=Ficus carica TaxID=3494 RepID=A0AA87ZAK6_FICCA|nr:hypothetical protein TIFTF001_040294 [Ficus carica]